MSGKYGLINLAVSDSEEGAGLFLEKGNLAKKKKIFYIGTYTRAPKFLKPTKKT